MHGVIVLSVTVRCSLFDYHRIALSLHPDEQWCGGSEGEEIPLEKRLVDFAKTKWGNKGFDFMIPGVLCDPSFQICGSEHTVCNTAMTPTWGIVQPKLAYECRRVGFKELRDLLDFKTTGDNDDQ